MNINHREEHPSSREAAGDIFVFQGVYEVYAVGQRAGYRQCADYRLFFIDRRATGGIATLDIS
jgi:hypothetical protein